MYSLGDVDSMSRVIEGWKIERTEPVKAIPAKLAPNLQPSSPRQRDSSERGLQDWMGPNVAYPDHTPVCQHGLGCATLIHVGRVVSDVSDLPKSNLRALTEGNRGSTCHIYPFTRKRGI